MKKIVILLLLILLSADLMTGQEKKAITPEDMWAMKRIKDVVVSPDESLLAFTVGWYDADKNEGYSAVYTIKPDGSDMKKLIDSDKNISSPLFLPSSKKIAWSMDGQIYLSNYDGSSREQMTELYSGASGARFSDDEKKIIFSSMVYPDLTSMEENKKRDEEKKNNQVSAKIFTELMYKHWNDWRGEKRSHLFLQSAETGKYTDLNLLSDSDVPPLALGGNVDYAMSPDGNEVCFSMNPDKMLAASTNNEIYILDIRALPGGKAGKPKKISESKGNDNQPSYSPDGKYIAFRSMKRAGFEADELDLILFDRNSGKLKNITPEPGFSIGETIWSPDSKYIYFTTANTIYTSICRLDINNGDIKIILEKGDNGSITLSGDGKTIYFLQQRSTLPKEIFAVSSEGKNLRQVTYINKDILAGIEWNPVETFWSEGAEGAKVQSILVKPPFFDENKKYPVILLIHGGPQGHWTDDFHYRWNLQMFASKGYVVIAPNPRGSTGYGQKFTDEISQDWGGKVYIDIMNSVDYAQDSYSFIDENNLFAAGASYGGYMINWIEGHTDKFNALLCHAGVFNLESMYGATEELWFPEWEFGGAPWENRELYKKWSPHNFVENFKTPMLVVHGAYDFRVPEGQAFELFTSLQKMGVKSKLIYFPDEYHFVIKPQNALFWWKSVFEWFEENKK